MTKTQATYTGSALALVLTFMVPTQALAQANASEKDSACTLQPELGNVAAVESKRADLVALQSQFESEKGLANDLYAETSKAADEWFVGYKNFRDQLNKYREIEKRLEVLGKLPSDTPGAEAAAELSAQIEADTKALKAACKAVGAARTPLSEKGAIYTRFTRLAAISLAYGVPAPATPGDQEERKEARLGRAQAKSCPPGKSYADTQEDAYNLPCATMRKGFELAKRNYGAPKNLSASRFSVPGRALDKRGVTSAVSATKSGSNISLGFKDEFRFRRPDYRGTGNQRISTIGYGLSLTTGADPFFSRTDNERANDPAEESLDRIATDTKIGASLSWNFYRPETASNVRDRANKMLTAAQTACFSEQKVGAEYPSSCEGDALLAWIFAINKKTGDYAHPATVSAWNAVYWGTKDGEKNARFGFGLSAEVGWNDFSFYNGTASAADLGKISTSKSKTDFSIAPYIYWAPTQKLSLVGQLSYKDEWKAAKKARFCSPSDAAPDFEGSLENCVDLAVQGPSKVDTFVPSIEARYLFSGFRRGRILIPDLGIAPKLAHDTNDNRWEAEFPIYFVADEGKLTGGLKLVNEWGGKDPAEIGVAIFASTTFSIQP
ncbi:hypothetical protein [Pontixanthobacter luteolus]|uniref:hypothetical protein n=1 Tax=Pontixanthobacter luteolus TaxID=295089 RepID=UPI0023029B88|nr:hypothetical protein [Pontixanthobacter luteolus]